MPIPLNNNNVDPLTGNFEEVRSRVRQSSMRRRTLTSGSGSGSGRVAEEESDTEVRSHERTRQKKFCKYFKELQGEFVTESKFKCLIPHIDLCSARNRMRLCWGYSTPGTFICDGQLLSFPLQCLWICHQGRFIGIDNILKYSSSFDFSSPFPFPRSGVSPRRRLP